MKKIGIITQYADNFGSILQCYATKKILENDGYLCEVLFEREHTHNWFCTKLISAVRIIQSLLKDRNYLSVRKIIKNTPNPLALETKMAMDSFVEEYITPKGISFRELNKKENEYYAFIIGSDQVWNLNNNIPSINFGEFTSSNKIIPFAVSLGTDNYSKKLKKKLSKKIANIKKISVREESGKDLLKEITDVEIEVISDPTIMLTRNEWIDFSEKDKTINNYILIHFLDCPSETAIKNIIYLQKNIGCEVLGIGYFYSVFEQYGWEFKNCNPKEYVSYINNAVWVCTDSFHTTLFSINFSKDFYVFERQYLHNHPQTSRIKCLLDKCHMSNRFIDYFFSDVNGVEKNISYSFEYDRIYSIDYLRTQLKLVGESF